MGFVNRKAIALGSLLILSLLALNAVLVFANLRTITAANERLAETRGFLIELDAVEKLLHDVEANQAGFLLSGDLAQLKAFEDAAAKLPERIKGLRDGAADSLEAQEKLDTLATLSQANLFGLRDGIETRRRSGIEGVVRMERPRGDVASLLKAKTILRDVTDIQAQNLSLWTDRSQAAVRSTILVFTVSTMMGAVLVACVAYLQKRDADRAEMDGHRIKTSEAWLATTLTTIREALIATDAQAKIRLVNPLAEELIGWTQDEAYGRPILDVMRLIDPSTGRPTDNPVERLIYEGRPEGTSGATVVVAKGGRETPIEHDVSPIITDDDEWLGVVLAFRITAGATT